MLLLFSIFFSGFPMRDVARGTGGGDLRGDTVTAGVSKMTPTGALVELMLLPMTAVATATRSGAGAGGSGEEVRRGLSYCKGHEAEAGLEEASVVVVMVVIKCRTPPGQGFRLPS